MKCSLSPKSIWVPLILFLLIMSGRASAYSADNTLQNLLPQDNLPAYFVSTFDDLMWSKWSPTGDWAGDWQNDATAFAPELLFQVDKSIGDAPGPFYQRATQTGVWEKHLITTAIQQVLHGQIDTFALFNTAVGTYSFVACARYGIGSDATDCKAYLRSVLGMANFVLLSPIFQWLHLFDGQEAVLYSRLAFMNVQYYQITGLAYYLNSAEELMAKLERLADPKSTGLFGGSYFGWDQASPLVAYATLYQVTHNELYLDKANAMIYALDQSHLLGESGVTESYWGFTETDAGTGLAYRHLDSSTHMQYLEAFTILAITTGDPYFLGRADAFKQFALQYLYIPNHNGTVPHFSHDIAWPVGASAPGLGQIVFNDAYCTGESFNFLRVVWKLLNYQQQ